MRLKRTIYFLTFMAIAAFAGAKTLSDSSGISDATDTVYEAVHKIDLELDTIYGYLNDLYTLQASGTAPTGDNTTNDLWFDTTTPALKYYDGANWQSLVSPTAYSSGLTLEDASNYNSHGCVLERDASTDDIMINASTDKPCTIYDPGVGLLQVSGKIALDVGDVAGHFYVYGVRTGTTTTFTLAKNAVYSDQNPNLGEVYVAESPAGSGNYWPVRVRSYDTYLKQKEQSPIGMFLVHQNGTADVNDGSYATKTFDTEDWDPDAFCTGGLCTPPNRGWYDVEATEFLHLNASLTLHCITINNGSNVIAENCNDDERVSVRAMMYCDGDDQISVSAKASASGGTTTITAAETTYVYSNALWGKWLGRVW